MCSRSHVASPPLPSPFQDTSSRHSTAQLVTARRCRRRELSALICGFLHPASCTVHTKRGFCFPCPQSTAIAHLSPLPPALQGATTRPEAPRRGKEHPGAAQGRAVPGARRGKGRLPPAIQGRGISLISPCRVLSGSASVNDAHQGRCSACAPSRCHCASQGGCRKQPGSAGSHRQVLLLLKVSIYTP